MVYKEIEGDLLKMALAGDFDLIAHGCNCYKIMGAGIALQISRMFNGAKEADLLDNRPPNLKLGSFSFSKEKEGFTILNLYTQLKPGKNLDYDALRRCLEQVNTLYKGKKIGLPQIGCGIAGGDWNVVKEMIKNTLLNLDVTVVIYNKQINL